MPSAPPDLFPLIPQARYGRLCPRDDWAGHDPKGLEDLSGFMKGPAPAEPPGADGDARLTMPSGYVYFGQFVDHDLTRDNTPLGDANPKAGATINFRSPRLNLEVLYGQGPAACSGLYLGDERLRIGETLPFTSPTPPYTSYPTSPNDLWRNPGGQAVVIDCRSDENVIIAQMHVLWCKVHNRLLELAQENDDLLVEVPAGSLFERVRQLVTWIYQWIVVHDFLPSFVRNDTLANVFVRRNLRLYQNVARPSQTPLRLPIEFTAAAFRFGHSMVRSEYSLSQRKGVPTMELIRMTQGGGGIVTRQRADFVVDWDLFLDEKPSINRGERIDTYITPALYELPDTILPQVTLIRGTMMRLPSGEEFAGYFGLPVLTEDKMATPGNAAAANLFQSAGFKGRTPLWYYLLRESAVEDIFEPGPRNGHLSLQKLGRVGSQIVAEVFYQVLMADKSSILNTGRHWQPPLCLFPSSSTAERLDTLLKLTRLVQS